MTSKPGFTLIELVITITIMAALLALAVVSLRSSQAVARDEERTTDVTAIAQALEAYRSGSFDYRTLGGYPLYFDGTYPPTAYFSNKQNITNALRNLNVTAMYAPGVSQTAAPSLVGATSTSNQTPTINTYIYQPLMSDGTLCNLGQTSTTSSTLEHCRRFTLYYRTEVDNQIRTITSKHQ